MIISDPHDGLSKDEKIVAEAKDRYKRAEEWEQNARNNFVFDMKFANGDSQNLFQWPIDVSRDRTSDNRPCLTINKTRQHCLQIINDQRQHPTQIEVRPVGGGASYEAAQIFEGVIRHIEGASHAQAAYSNAAYSQVIGGIGYWRIITDYCGHDSFDQDIFIRRIADPLSVYLDNDIQEADGSDARWAIIYRDMPRDQFEREYPEAADDLADNAAPLGVGSALGGDTWENDEHVRVCEYFRKTNKTDTLHHLDNGSTVRESQVKENGLMDQLKINSVRSRDIDAAEVEWFLIAGAKIRDRKIWPGKHIPIVRVIGEETVIDRTLDRKGHVRALIDPQRIYNFWSSAAVEFVALQSKTPFITAVEAIAGFEENWAAANIENKPYLPYNGLDQNGQKVERPERAPPPVMSQAYLEGMKIASSEMMMVSGQYEANLGVKSNEVSGTAVEARARQGDNSTYHYIDRMASAIRHTGRILVDLIPRIYDSHRIIKILSPTGAQSSVQVDPTQPQAHAQLQDDDSQEFNPNAVMAIFNPQVGEYDVEADVGPDYATRRQETWNAISQILKVNESLTPIVGDLLFRAADFPMAAEIAQRLHNMVPPQALGNKQPDPHIEQLQQQLAQQHDVMSKISNELQRAKMEMVNKEQELRLKDYQAETERMKAVGAIDPAAFQPIIRQLVSEALGTPINPIIAAHAKENAAMEQPPEPPPSPISPPSEDS